jgi:transcriptional regulator with XRE-family HTH domain
MGRNGGRPEFRARRDLNGKSETEEEASQRRTRGPARPQFLAQRVRELRKQRGLSHEGLGDLSSLTGKFIGEVERGDKSMSIDSLYKVSVSLGVPLGQLTNVARSHRGTVPSRDAEKIFALVSGRHPTVRLRRAYNMLEKMLDGNA